MLTSVRYFDLVREMKNAYNHRLRLVESSLFGKTNRLIIGLGIPQNSSASVITLSGILCAPG